MNENDPCMGQPCTITEADLINAVISIIDARRVFSNGGPTTEDCEKLKKVSADNCSKETKETVINFMMKFGKLYKKRFSCTYRGFMDI